MKPKIKIIYTGLDLSTFDVLRNECDFSIVAVSHIPNFSLLSLNPVNYLFKLIYTLRTKERARVLEVLLCFIWNILAPLSTNMYRRYTKYLSYISKHKTRVLDVYDPDTRNSIREAEYDLMIVSAWGMLPKEVIEAPCKGTVNIHPSKLPKYRGALPTLWSLKNGDDESAVTYILLSEKQDSGDIINQHTFCIDKTDNWHSLEVKVANIVAKTLVSDIKGYLSGERVLMAQDPSQASSTARYEAYRKIDFMHERGVDIFNKVNLYPFLEEDVCCYFNYYGRDVLVRRCTYIPTGSSQSIQQNLMMPRISFQTKDGTISMRLFFDVSFKDSLHMIKTRRQ